MQYMAAGLPVVCFDQENNRDHLSEGNYLSQKFPARVWLGESFIF